MGETLNAGPNQSQEPSLGEQMSEVLKNVQLDPNKIGQVIHGTRALSQNFSSLTEAGIPLAVANILEKIVEAGTGKAEFGVSGKLIHAFANSDIPDHTKRIVEPLQHVFELAKNLAVAASVNNPALVQKIAALSVQDVGRALGVQTMRQ